MCVSGHRAAVCRGRGGQGGLGLCAEQRGAVWLSAETHRLPPPGIFGFAAWLLSGSSPVFLDLGTQVLRANLVLFFLF